LERDSTKSDGGLYPNNVGKFEPDSVSRNPERCFSV
jgi:hypothetical protein